MGTSNPLRGAQHAEELLAAHGPLLSGRALWQSLGFPSGAAFRQAKARGQLGIRVFNLSERRGTYAFTRDVADWLRKLDEEAPM